MTEITSNLEKYFALGGTNSELADEYFSYQTPYHDEKASMTITTGLMSLLGDLLSAAPPHSDYDRTPSYFLYLSA